MCGIAGIVGDRPTAEMLGPMLEAIRHRGPDERGTYFDRPAALGHNRLSIIDLADGHQPMHNEDGSLTIVFNGEIFNYVELAEWLLGRGHQFRTNSDTEVIVHLFEEFGEQCVERLNGQWAFAIWDSPRRKLFLSRDRLGVRPLFFANAPGAFVFASEIKALFEYPGIDPEFDFQALNEIFTFWFTLPPRTVFRGIEELPPGHNLTLADGVVSVRRYWDLQYPTATEFAHDGAGHEERYQDELLDLLTDATRIRLRADVPVGAYLSGGLDSTVIAALACRFVDRMETFSVRFEDADLDEGAYQDDAVRHLETRHREIHCTAADIGRVFPEVTRHMEKPVLRAAPAPLFLLAELVHECGYKVVLTGEGSDEMLGGYDIFKELKIRRFCAAHPESKARSLLLKRLYPYSPRIQSQPAAYLKAFFEAGNGSGPTEFFAHSPRWRQTSRLKALFSDDVRAALDGDDPISRLRDSLPGMYGAWDDFTRAQYLEACHLLPGYILSSQGDRVAMAHAVEGRFPFLDHRLVEFAAKLPPNLKMKVLREKYLLKRVARDLAPVSVVERHKQPYRAPDARCFTGPQAPPYVSDLLSQSQIRHDGIFSASAVEKLVEKTKQGSGLGAAENMGIVGVLSTQLVIQQFMVGVRV